MYNVTSIRDTSHPGTTHSPTRYLTDTLGRTLSYPILASHGRGNLSALLGSHSSMARARATKAGSPRLNSWRLPWVFLLPACLLMLMGWRICGAPVRLGCYQHGYEWGEGSVVLQYSLAAINTDINGEDLWCSSCYQHRYEQEYNNYSREESIPLVAHPCEKYLYIP